MDDLTPISQVIGRQAPSRTWLSEKRTCDDCGQVFEVKWIQEIQKPPTIRTCRDCIERRQEQEARLAALKELEHAIESETEFWWNDSGVPARFMSKTFANFVRELQPQAYDVLLHYRYQYDYDREKPALSLLLLSPDLYGVGKTHLVCALVDRIISSAEKAALRGLRVVRRPCPVYFIREAQLLSQIRATYSHPKEGETEEDIYAKLAKFPLLILDDVGKVRPRDYSFLQGVYYRVIDDRYTSEQPVILTTNLDYAELEKHLGGATADRLREMCGRTGFIKMAGRSFRVAGGA